MPTDSSCPRQNLRLGLRSLGWLRSHPTAFEALARLLGHLLPRAGLSRPRHAWACRLAQAEPMEMRTWQEASASSSIFPPERALLPVIRAQSLEEGKQPFRGALPDNALEKWCPGMREQWYYPGSPSIYTPHLVCVQPG